MAGALTLLVPSGPAPAAPAPVRAPMAGACRDATGITVVVDFTAFDGGVQVRCAPQPVSSGFEALERAGFGFTGTVRFPGLLCRIDGLPSSDPCHGAPPPNAYWAYWHASRGGSWTYSSSGAGSRVPPAGSVEGWAFGDDAEPGVAPPVPVPSTTPTTRPPSTSTTGPGGGGDGSSDGTTTTTTAPAVAGSDADPTTTTDEVDPNRAPSGPDPEGEDSSSSDGERDGDEATAPDAPSGGRASGSPIGALVAVGLAGSLAVGAIVSARRRRPVEKGST